VSLYNCLKYCFICSLCLPPLTNANTYEAE
jgi:hypothetical protein